MKREKELIREIMLYLENQKNISIFTFDNYEQKCEVEEFSDYTMGDLSGHLKLLIEDDYLEGKPNKTSTGFIFGIRINSITMKGYDLIDSIRDTGIWREVKKGLGVAGESWNVELIVKLATKIIAKKVGL